MPSLVNSVLTLLEDCPFCDSRTRARAHTLAHAPLNEAQLRHAARADQNPGQLPQLRVPVTRWGLVTHKHVKYPLKYPMLFFDRTHSIYEGKNNFFLPRRIN